MAEAWWNVLAKGSWQAESAGSHPSGQVHPLAIAVMGEVGITISGHQSKHVDTFQDQRFDLVVTVCENARQSCTAMPGALRAQHWPFDDPAAAEGNEQARLAVFRRVRDEIKSRIEAFLREQPPA